SGASLGSEPTPGAEPPPSSEASPGTGPPSGPGTSPGAEPPPPAGAEVPGGTRPPSRPGTSSGAEAPWRDFRVYRVDRFTAVVSGEERFRRDTAFELPAFWEERAVEFARSILRERVVLRLTPDGARRLPHVTDRLAAQEALAAGDADGQGRITVTLPVESSDVAYSQLLGLGPEAEVLGPAALRERFARTAREMAERYGPG
ncbi:WYL domain-containing protein, partial [Streptomyces sp. NPDC057654]|uniref:WYL domain-containing protein n=1 Tax=Streptomyces sp. NPDC057654 TaxID=3346196 RepID=UPI00367C761B